VRHAVLKLWQTFFVFRGMGVMFGDDECVNIDSVKLTSALVNAVPDPQHMAQGYTETQKGRIKIIR
jgi:hypothetical protein